VREKIISAQFDEMCGMVSFLRTFSYGSVSTRSVCIWCVPGKHIPSVSPMYISFIMLEVVWCITSDTMNKLITDYVAVDLDDRPSSLVECLAMDGLTLDSLKYWQYQDKEDELGDLMLKMPMSYNRKRLSLASVGSKKKIGKKNRKGQAVFHLPPLLCCYHH
jgi:hypothetical protein